MIADFAAPDDLQPLGVEILVEAGQTRPGFWIAALRSAVEQLLADHNAKPAGVYSRGR